MKRYVPEVIKRPYREYREKYRVYQATHKRTYYPEILVLETTTKCNAGCIYCGRLRENNDMSLELFKAIVRASPFVKEVHPNTRGEPLLYPHIIEAIQFCKDLKKTVGMYTNGSCVTKKMALELLNCGLDKITFSIDDCDPKRYALTRRGTDFYEVQRNLRRMVALRDARRYQTKIFVRATLTDINRDHQQEIREFWSFADNFRFVPVIDVMPYEQAKVKPLHFNEEPLYCPDPWETLAVRWDGTPVLCCNDWHDNFPIWPQLDEYVTTEEIVELFNKGLIREYREQMLEGTIPSICIGCRNRRGG